MGSHGMSKWCKDCELMGFDFLSLQNARLPCMLDCSAEVTQGLHGTWYSHVWPFDEGLCQYPQL